MSLQLAEQFEANEQYEQAFEEYKKELEADPNDVGIFERLGHLSLILGNTDEAAKYYYEILKRDVTNPLAYEQLMSIYENTDRYKYYVYRGNKNSLENKIDFAINDFKKALAHVGDDEAQIVMTRLTLANLYRKAGNKMKAIDEFNIIIEYQNLNEDIFLQMADLYMEDAVYSSAIDVLQRAKQKGFDTPRINEAMATVYLKSGDAKSAIEYTNDELLKIQCMLELGQVAEAYSQLKNLPDEYKNTPRYQTLQAQYYYSSKEFEKALEAIEEYNKLEPNSPLTYQMRALVYDETGDEYHAHVNWGIYNMLRGNKDIAVNEFLNAVQLRADDVNVMFTLADLLTENGDVNHASEYYEKILKIEPENKEALKKLAAYRESIGDYDSQVRYLEKLYVTDKKEPEALKNLAKAYERIKDRQSAVKAYNKCLELINDPAEYKLIKDKIDKLDTFGSSDASESEGLIDKIMKLFGGNK